MRYGKFLTENTTDAEDIMATSDGGKYTDKCSKKCYKEIYGNKTIKKQSNVDLSYAAVEKLAQKSYNLDECVAKSPTFDYTQLNDGTSAGVYKGCYWWDAGSINWKGDIVSEESKQFGL